MADATVRSVAFDNGFTEFVTDAPAKWEFADGKRFPSVLTPLESVWSLFPLAFMTSFLFLWLFREKFWEIYGFLEERTTKYNLGAARLKSETTTTELDVVDAVDSDSDSKDYHIVRL